MATSALGMGFDATLGFVVNLGAPQSPVAYYQQVGRAGRGIDEASVVLLPALEDRDIWAYFASLAFPREELVQQTLAALAEEGRPLSTAALETRVELSRTRLETMLKVLDVDGAVRRVGGGWTATGQPWVYDAERYARVAEAREREQQAMLDYLATDRCRMQFLRDQLDDPEAAPCGRCDNCGGLTLADSISDAALDAASERLARPGVVVAPRKMWPTGLASLDLDLKGKIADGAEEGRAVARLTDLGHGQALRELFREGTEDGPVPVGLARAVVDVLGDWKPSVTAIAVVESATRPRLVQDLAAGLSRHLQVPVAGTFAIVDASVPPGRGAVNSAQRVAAVSRRFAWRPAAEASPLDGADVLLVDDQALTGWTLTLAAQALRAGRRGRRPPVGARDHGLIGLFGQCIGTGGTPSGSSSSVSSDFTCLRGRKKAGTRVSATRTQATQNVSANAAAASVRPSATAAAPPTLSIRFGSRVAAIAGLARSEAFRWAVRITEITATPTELPICWLMFSRVEPRATSWALSVFSADVNSGIIVPPMPRPSTNSSAISRGYDVSAVTWVRPKKPITMTTRPTGTIRPTGSRSLSVPAIGMVSIAPMPCGATSRPAVRADSPRICWK